MLGNFGREAANQITGLPASAKTLGGAVYSDVREHPWSLLGLATAPLYAAAAEEVRGDKSALRRDVLTPAAEDYAYRYGPLFEGFGRGWSPDLGEFAHRTGERPLSFALDVVPAAAATTKGLTATRIIGKAPRSYTLRSPGAVAGREGAHVIEKQIVGSELGRRMRVGVDRTLKKLPPEFAVLGETQRYARSLRLRELKDYTRLRLRATPREAAKRGLSTNEFVAANVLADFPLQADLDRLVAGLREVEGAGATVKLLSSPKVRKLYENPTAKMARYMDEENKLLGRMEELVPMGAESLEQRRYLPSLLARGAKFEDDVLTADRPIPEMIAEVKAELQAAGRPEPRYRPQKSVPEKSGTTLASGGIGVQRSPLKQNKGVLQAMGRVAYDIDTLQPAYMRTIKWASYTDRHADLVAAAKPVDSLPEGHIYIKRSLNERIGYTERTGEEFQRRMSELIDADENGVALGTTRQNELTTADAADAATDAQGRRLAVSERFAKTIVGEYQRSNLALRYLWEKPTDVWRAIVLNLRVGWLVNNLVGNTLLFLLKNGGPEGMKAYYRALGDTKAGKRFRRDASKVLSPEDMIELFPEHVSGTFMGTQVPDTGLAGKLSRYSPTRPLRAADVGYEQAVRRAMATKLARQNPKVKARMKEMPKETRSFRKAARETLDESDVERISKQINDALGDFFSLGTAERGWVRRWVPFYAWYKAITLITLKLPIDAPGRTAILANLGKIGAEESEDYGLPWLQGAVPLNDEGMLLGTRGANPFATPTDIGRSLFAGDWFASRQREGMLNPIPDSLFSALEEEGPLPERLALGLAETAKGLPFSRLAFPEERESYEGDPRLRELLAYLGFPIKQVSKDIREDR